MSEALGRTYAFGCACGWPHPEDEINTGETTSSAVPIVDGPAPPELNPGLSELHDIIAAAHEPIASDLRRWLDRWVHVAEASYETTKERMQADSGPKSEQMYRRIESMSEQGVYVDVFSPDDGQTFTVTARLAMIAQLSAKVTT